MADEDLIELGKREIVQIGLANYEDIEDGCVFRVEKSYPVYDSDYAGYLAIIKKYVATLKNCQSVGRNGLHRYNNQDHAMLTGMLAVRNLLNGESNDLWQINGEQVYLEEIRINDECVKTDDVVGAVQEALAHVFLKLDPTAFGISVGSVGGLLLLLTTLGLVWRGDETVTSYWQLLNQFFPGYSVSAGGSLLGLIYGFVVGFIIGWGFAFLRNVITAFYLASFYRSAERSVLSTFLEHI
jgi:hypothetical protein